ncbi:hypothetical protein [Rhizobium ruizarguesonis]|uniref:hypothetical protein n=1 Tax=Rhizobium ruizarguesonis TaxID=2081791 RepID=UPI001FDF7268|nr:hypothetical protein [Rhizobium ruizarguesonis]
MMAQEGHLVGVSFLTGFYLFNRTTFDRPGTFYSSFFEFSTGFERLMKIIVILDHKTKNDLRSPTDKQLRSLGHSIIECYNACRTIADARGLAVPEEWFSEGSLEHSVLLFFSEFAQGSRYYNLDQLVKGRTTNDPLIRWYKVQMAVVERYLPLHKREAIMQLARDHCERYRLYGWERGPRGEFELTIDVTYQLEVFRKTRGHCVWTILKILRPFYDLLDRLCDEVHEIEMSKGIETPTVPYMKEFVPFFLCDRQSAIRRKDWLSLGFGI